jgi:hypothetical protein
MGTGAELMAGSYLYFTFTGLPPGTYKLFAWENLPNGAEQVVGAVYDRPPYLVLKLFGRS